GDFVDSKLKVTVFDVAYERNLYSWDEGYLNFLAGAGIHTKEGCPDCWARYYCSGGCHANAHLFNGSIFRPYDIECRLMKKRLECSLMIRAVDGLK
ncbi:MAG: SPASM domain-containing protein, partial [Firmicutes bacterium]|nr:SPASM domain-containing protein [Bacillota bacterium]